MPPCLPEIIVADTAANPSKRRRLDTPDIVGVANTGANVQSQHTPSSSTPLYTNGETKEVCEEELVCYGMVCCTPSNVMACADIIQISDLAVSIPSFHHATSPVSTGYSIRFEPPRTLYLGHSNTQRGRLGEFAGALLTRLVADDEFILQYLLSSAPIATTIEKKVPKNVPSFLAVILYGPKRRFSDVGNFTTQAGCFLDDPIKCDRNVPYMNPQYLSSLYEPPSMTFELLQPQRPQAGEYTRPSVDILSGFETTCEIELADSPPALRTELKRCAPFA